MYIVWEGRYMGKMTAIIYYEFKMQIKRPVTWGILLAVTALSLADNFPSAANLARLEFLDQPAYFVYRIMSFDALLLLFGLLFLLAGRFPMDRKNGMKSLLISFPLKKWQYVRGKLIGGFFYTFCILCVFLTGSTMIYFIAAPFKIHMADCVLPLLKVIVVSGIPSSLFVSFCSVAIPGLIDIRLFYILAAVLFGINASCVGSAEAMPFYLITAGDLVRLVWMHPAWPFTNMESVLANGIFLLGGGLLPAGLLFLKRGFWRRK